MSGGIAPCILNLGNR